jgi:hypothetical protein
MSAGLLLGIIVTITLSKNIYTHSQTHRQADTETVRNRVSVCVWLMGGGERKREREWSV